MLKSNTSITFYLDFEADILACLLGVANDAADTTKSENHMDIDDESSDNKVADETLSSISSPARNGEQSSTNGIEIRSQRPNQEQQPVPSPVSTPTFIHRTSTGTQLDDIVELAPRTAILNTNGIENTAISHVSLSPLQQTSSHSLLAVGGSQLGQIWEIAKQEFSIGDRETNDQATSVSATQDFKTIDLAVEPGSSLTSLAWSHDGDRLAYSTYSDVASGNQHSVIKIRLPSADKASDVYGPVGEAVTSLVWNNTGRYVAGLSASSVLVFDTKTSSQLRPLDTGHTLYDIAWLDKETLIVCGNSCVAIVTINGTNVDLTTEFSDLAGLTEWTKLQYSTSTNSIAVASEASGQIAIIESTGNTHIQTAHTSGLSDMIDCPTSSDDAGPRILATSSSEGHVKIWRFDSQISLVQRLEMGGVSQALTLSFNPSGNLLAVADWDKILFWDTHGSVLPKFKWELRRVNWPAAHVNGNLANGINGHDHEISMEETFELTPILIWEGSGHNLIFAHKEKVCLTLFRKYLLRFADRYH